MGGSDSARRDAVGRGREETRPLVRTENRMSLRPFAGGPIIWCTAASGTGLFSLARGVCGPADRRRETGGLGIGIALLAMRWFVYVWRGGAVDNSAVNPADETAGIFYSSCCYCTRLQLACGGARLVDSVS